MNRRMALQLMLLCLLMAAALRVPDLTEIPPGLHFDEAANGILAADIGLRGQRPIFISSYTGKEVLFFYLAGAFMRLIGESVFTLRLTSAYLGIFTVAVTYWLGRKLLGDRQVAMMAAVLLAISFWHVLFSRLGFRAITQPLMQALTVGMLFHGLRQRSWRQSWPWLVTAGFFLGLTAYTYLAARAFPILLGVALLPLLLISQTRKRRLIQLAVFTGAGLLILAPLSSYFVANPEAFWVRIGQVLPGDSAIASLTSSYQRALGMFFLAGDPYWRFNIPELPIFNWLWGGLFVIGWVIAWIRVFRRSTDWQPSAYLLLALSPLLMLLPTALAIGDIVPSNLRAIGLLPFLYFLPALGFVVSLDWVRRGFGDIVKNRPIDHSRLAITQRAFSGKISLFRLVIFLVILVGGGVTARAYFQIWATRADVYYDSDADLVAVSQFLDGRDRDDETIYLAALHYRHPTIAFLSERYDDVKWLPKSQALVFPQEGRALTIFPHTSPLQEWATPFMVMPPLAEGPAGPDGQPTFTAYRQSIPGDFTPANLIQANFDNLITVLGYEVGQATGDGTLPLKLFWRVEELPPAGFQLFVHLQDEWRYRWSQVESFAYPAEQWSPGDIVVQQIEVPIQPGTPPGLYQLRIGFFDPSSGQQLPLLEDSDRYAGNAMSIEGILIEAGPSLAPVSDPPHLLNAQAGPDLTLLGYEMVADTIASGASFWLALWWQAKGPLEPMLTRLELFRPDNTGQILLDTQPVHGTYPFTDWPDTGFVIDHLRPEMPKDVPAGEYLLSLRLLNGADDTVMMVDLGPVTVETVDRLFSPPVMQFPLAATFGDEIQLLGYDLLPDGPGQFNLNLAWQALGEPSESYTVFVHVLERDGTCCIWQQDVTPKQGTYATDGWLADEVILDEYVIMLPVDIPAGQYPLEIGLYLADSGRRLVAEMTGLRDNDALILRPLQVE